MPTSSFDSKNPHRNQKFQLESFPVYFVPSQKTPKQSPLRVLVAAHKIFFTFMSCAIVALIFYSWQFSGYKGADLLFRWIHEIAAGVLLIATIVLWGIFYQRHSVRKKIRRNQNQKMELTAISSKIIVMSPHQVEETPVYIASESLSIDYWVSRETMAVSDEDLAIGNLPRMNILRRML